MDIQEEWDRFLIDSWIIDRGRSMGIMIASFHMDHDIREVRYDNPLGIKKYPTVSLKNLDVFGFIARYFPRVSSWLLAHVKNHQINPETKEKIIQAFLKMKMPVKNGGVGRQLDGKAELMEASKEYQATITGNKISVGLSRGRHAWHVTK